MAKQSRRMIVKLKKSESALIIRSDKTIEIIGKVHKQMLTCLGAAVFSENKKLIADIIENYKTVMEEGNINMVPLKEE